MRSQNEIFFNYFKARAKFIKDNCLLKIEGLILMCCCLDALAVNWKSEKSSFSLFREFVIAFSGHGNIWQKISLPLLKEQFEKDGNLKYAECMRKLGVNENSYFTKGYDVDITIDEIEPRVINDVPTPFSDGLREKINNFEYAKIFWKKYRCFSIHELRSNPEKAQNIFCETAKPYYNHESVYKNGEISQGFIRIDFPPEFIFKTLTNCLYNLENYINKNNIILGK